MTHAAVLHAMLPIAVLAGPLFLFGAISPAVLGCLYAACIGVVAYTRAVERKETGP